MISKALLILTIIIYILTILSYSWATKYYFNTTNKNIKTSKRFYVSAVSFLIITQLYSFYIDLNTNIPIINTSITLLILICGLILFWKTVKVGNRNFFQFAFSNIPPDHLITEGTFKYIRHPFYTSYILTWVGAFVYNYNLYQLIFIIPIIIFYIKSALYEEKLLLNGKISDKYKKYMTFTGRFFPRVL